MARHSRRFRGTRHSRLALGWRGPLRLRLHQETPGHPFLIGDGALFSSSGGLSLRHPARGKNNDVEHRTPDGSRDVRQSRPPGGGAGVSSRFLLLASQFSVVSLRFFFFFFPSSLRLSFRNAFLNFVFSYFFIFLFLFFVDSFWSGPFLSFSRVGHRQLQVQIGGTHGNGIMTCSPSNQRIWTGTCSPIRLDQARSGPAAREDRAGCGTCGRTACLACARSFVRALAAWESVERKRDASGPERSSIGAAFPWGSSSWGKGRIPARASLCRRKCAFSSVSVGDGRT